MEAHRITVDEVSKRLDQGQEILFVDTRDPKEWASSEVKLPLAVRIPADQVADHLAELPHEGPIVTYCTRPHEGSSARAALIMSEAGLRNVFALEGGLDAWRDAGMPLVPKEAQQTASQP